MTTAKQLLEAFDEKFIYGEKQEDGSTKYTLATKDKLHDFIISALRQAQESVRPLDDNHSGDIPHCNCTGYEVRAKTKKFWEGVV